MISSTRRAVARSPPSAPGPSRRRCASTPGLHAHVAAEHQVVEHGQAAEQRDVLEGARDAQRGDVARASCWVMSRPSSAMRPVSGL